MASPTKAIGLIEDGKVVLFDDTIEKLKTLVNEDMSHTDLKDLIEVGPKVYDVNMQLNEQSQQVETPSVGNNSFNPIGDDEPDL